MPRASLYLHAFFPRALPTAPVLPPEEEDDCVGPGFRRETLHPRAPHTFILGLRSVEGDLPTPFSLDSGNGPSLSAPAGPGTWGGRGGGRTRATALLLHHLLFSVQPWGAAHPSPLFPFLPWPGHSSPVPGLLLSFWAPRSHRCGPGVFGPSALTARLVGSAAPLPISGDRPPESRGC